MPGGRYKDAVPTRAMDAAKSGLQHLQEQERMLTSKCLPEEDPVEAAFKAPEPLPHKYALPKANTSALRAPVPLRLPRALQALSRPLEYSMEHSMGSVGSTNSVSYHKVRRWDMLPKHAWLQAAESGQAPGPGYRDVSVTQPLRSYGPLGAEPLSAAEPEEPADAPEPKYGLSGVIGQHYSPSAKGLAPATLTQMLKEGLPVMEEEPEPEPVAVAPTLIPILQVCNS